MKFFGDNLKYLRKLHGLTQAEIKARLGIEATTWGNYERGQSFPNLNLFSEIVKYFGVSADDLLYKAISKGNLNEKIETEKNEEKSNLNSNLTGNLNTEKAPDLHYLNEEESPFKYSLNEGEAPYNSQQQQIDEMAAKLAKMEGFMTKLLRELEGQGKPSPRRAKKM